MINFETYITLLFSIVIALLTAFITIFTSNNISNSKKRNSFIILFSTFILLIAFATLLYCLNSYFCISDLFPFTKVQFSEPTFKTKYKTYCVACLCMLIEIYIIILLNCDDEIGFRADASVAFDKKYAIITIIFHFLISTYFHIWFIYGLCYFSFKIFVDVIISLVVFFMEICILYNINKYLTLRKERHLLNS